jgi:prolyl 3-hydroxylase /prolyl 3,4-dihydroxylase
LINDDLLRAVREEIRENVHFTPKETDIYKIHQSGDLANLDGLDDGALEKLPSLLKLRDAMYSSSFRKYVSTITGCGELSGRKTDMAINVYTPGSYLLCHDDVIGSRRVSYILYLTDPDLPWKAEWGGALRLFPTKTFEDEKGEKTVTPSPDVSKVIPPAWNQLSFFAVQPGESFHDVEEVYHAETREQLEKDRGRIRMAISGWYHIPQIGEDGYIEGEEQKWGTNSSLKQLQGHPDRYDFPKPAPVNLESPVEPNDEEGLDPEEFDFLIKYMAPGYLTPDTLDQVSAEFMEMSSVTLDGLLSDKFSARVREYIEGQEAHPESSQETEKGSWKVARPPHKHRFLYRHPSETPDDSNPLHELLNVFLPSEQFRKWLALATKCTVQSYELLGRRFRRGQDYSLATTHDGEPRLEISLGLTPTPGWGADDADEDEDEESGAEKKTHEPKQLPANGDSEKASDGQSEGSDEVPVTGEKTNGKAKTNGKPKEEEDDEEDDVGGHEVYMAGDDEEDNEDAAIYKTSSDADEDNVLFTMPASWNKMSIVLRDSGVLKFVKYVSRNAKGDRWDVSGSFGVLLDEDDEEGEEGEEFVTLEESSDDGVFKGFPDSEDSDSD